ncbi:MAG: VgrG-related protein [Chloroflexota bacterium]|nr:VgrG-related protein [Chloroflexota bacterium]
MTTTEKASKNELVFSYCRVKVNGTELSSELKSNLALVEVEQSLHLPSMFLVQVRESNMDMKLFDSNPFKVGAEIQIEMAQDKSLVSILKGEITSLEMELDTRSTPILTVRGYDKLHHLNRGRKTRVFVKKTDSDMVKDVAAGAGLSDASDSTSLVYEYTLQNNETDFEFLKRRAYRIGMELLIDDGKLKMRKPLVSGGKVATVEWGKTLFQFSSRHSTAYNVDKVAVRGWDSKTKKAIVGTSSKSQKTFSGANLAAFSRPVVNQGEAETLAKAIHEELARRAIQFEGTCIGDPKLKPGAVLEIKGLGTTFGGEFYLTSCTHQYNSAQGSYLTRFEANGQQSNTLLELANQAAGGHFETVPGPVIGLITNLKDPDDKGRVKVKFPWLSDSKGVEVESDWARVVSPMAGAGRGFFFLPEVDDEVLVAFEQGDIQRPYVLGAMWNGKDAPPKKNADVITGEGKVKERILKTRLGHTISFDDSDDAPKITIIDKTTKNKIIIDSKSNKITIESDADMELKATKGKISLDAKEVEIKGTDSAKMSSKAVEVTGNQTVEIKGTQSAKMSGAQLEIKASASGKIDGGGMLEVKGGVIKLN